MRLTEVSKGLAVAVGLSLAVAAPSTANAYPGEIAISVCQYLDASPEVPSSITGAMAIMVNAGMSDYAAGAEIGGAIRNYCPWHTGNAVVWLRLHGYQVPEGAVV